MAASLKSLSRSLVVPLVLGVFLASVAGTLVGVSFMSRDREAQLKSEYEQQIVTRRQDLSLREQDALEAVRNTLDTQLLILSRHANKAIMFHNRGLSRGDTLEEPINSIWLRLEQCGRITSLNAREMCLQVIMNQELQSMVLAQEDVNMEQTMLNIFSDANLHAIEITDSERELILGFVRLDDGRAQPTKKRITVVPEGMSLYEKSILNETRENVGTIKMLYSLGYVKRIRENNAKLIHEFEELQKEKLAQDVENLVSKSLHWSIALLAMETIAVSIVTFFIIIKPILTLKREAEELAKDFSRPFRVLTDSKNELGTLARSFSNLQEAIQDRVEAMNEVNVVAAILSRAYDRQEVLLTLEKGTQNALRHDSVELLQGSDFLHVHGKLAQKAAETMSNQECALPDGGLVIAMPIDDVLPMVLLIQMKPERLTQKIHTQEVAFTVARLAEEALRSLMMRIEIEQKNTQLGQAMSQVKILQESALALLTADNVVDLCRASGMYLVKDLMAHTQHKPQQSHVLVHFKMNFSLAKLPDGEISILYQIKGHEVEVGTIMTTGIHGKRKSASLYAKNFVLAVENEQLGTASLLANFQVEETQEFLDFCNTICHELSLAFNSMKNTEERWKSQLEKEKARLEDLGKVAIFLGDRISTPLNVLQLAVEEITDAAENQSSVSSQTLNELTQEMDRAVEVISQEIDRFKKYRVYVQNSGIVGDIHEPDASILPKTG